MKWAFEHQMRQGKSEVVVGPKPPQISLSYDATWKASCLPYWELFHASTTKFISHGPN